MLKFTQKPRKPLKRSWIRKSTKNPSKSILKSSRLRIKGVSTSATLKQEIQDILRAIIILRDGGCWLRNFPEAGACGGRRKDGGLILQAEHLNTRERSISYADSRLVVCICRHHHIHWKPQHSARYNELAREFIGEERTKLWDRVKNDHKPYKMDWKMELLALQEEYKKLKHKYQFNP